MSLIKDLIDPSFKEKTIWIKYIDDFEIELRYLSRAAINRIVEKSRERTWDKKDHTQIERMNPERFYKDFIEKIMVDWRGLTAKTLAKMLPVKIEDPDMKIPFTPENAFELMKEAYDFDIFIQQTVMDIEKFQIEKLDEEIKNLSSSQGG